MKEEVNINVGVPSNRAMSYGEAEMYVREQGMRLPTAIESLAIVKHAKELGIGFVDSWWTNDTMFGSDKMVAYYNGAIDIPLIYHKRFAIPVADIKE